MKMRSAIAGKRLSGRLVAIGCAAVVVSASVSACTSGTPSGIPTSFSPGGSPTGTGTATSTGQPTPTPSTPTPSTPTPSTPTPSTTPPTSSASASANAATSRDRSARPPPRRRASRLRLSRPRHQPPGGGGTARITRTRCSPPSAERRSWPEPGASFTAGESSGTGERGGPSPSDPGTVCFDTRVHGGRLPWDRRESWPELASRSRLVPDDSAAACPPAACPAKHQQCRQPAPRQPAPQQPAPPAACPAGTSKGLGLRLAAAEPGELSGACGVLGSGGLGNGQPATRRSALGLGGGLSSGPAAKRGVMNIGSGCPGSPPGPGPEHVASLARATTPAWCGVRRNQSGPEDAPRRWCRRPVGAPGLRRACRAPDRDREQAHVPRDAPAAAGGSASWTLSCPSWSSGTPIPALAILTSKPPSRPIPGAHLGRLG